MIPTALSFYLVAIPAVIITGLGKGGLGNALGMIAVPLMAFSISPVEAAAIMLPLLLAMDAFAIYGYRHHIDWSVMQLILPAGLLGVFFGALLFESLSDEYIRLLIGLIAISFCFYQWFKRFLPVHRPGKVSGVFWSTVAGFTSYGIHAGGPPLSIYMLPLKMNKQLLAGTMAVFFGIINLAKLVAYGQVGQMNQETLIASAVLMPICPLSVFMGKMIVNKVNEKVFYRLLFTGLFCSGIKLLYDGIVPLIQSFLPTY